MSSSAQGPRVNVALRAGFEPIRRRWCVAARKGARQGHRSTGTAASPRSWSTGTGSASDRSAAGPAAVTRAGLRRATHRVRRRIARKQRRPIADRTDRRRRPRAGRDVRGQGSGAGPARRRGRPGRVPLGCAARAGRVSRPGQLSSAQNHESRSAATIACPGVLAFPSLAGSCASAHRTRGQQPPDPARRPGDHPG